MKLQKVGVLSLNWCIIRGSYISELKRADFQFETKTEIKIEIQKRTQIGGKRGKIKMKDKYRFKLNFSWNHSQQCCAFHRRAAVKKVIGQLNVICIIKNLIRIIAKFYSHNCKCYLAIAIS